MSATTKQIPSTFADLVPHDLRKGTTTSPRSSTTPRLTALTSARPSQPQAPTLSSIQKVQKIVVKVLDVYYEKSIEAFKTSMIIEHKFFDETQELANTRKHNADH